MSELATIQKVSNSDEAASAIRKLTKAQRHALDYLCIGQRVPAATRTWEALEARGLIEGFEKVLAGRFPVKIREHRVPLFVHIAWAEVCGAEYQEGD